MFETAEVKEVDLAKIQSEVVEMKRCLSELEDQLDRLTKSTKLLEEGNAADESLKRVSEESPVTNLFPTIPHSLFMELLRERVKLIDDIGKEQRRLMDCLLIGNENFIQNTMIVILRALRLAEFHSIKKRAEAYMGKSLSTVNHETKSVASSEAKILRGIQADNDSSLANEAWVSNMDEAYRKLSEWMNSVDEISNRGINKSMSEIRH